MIKLKKKNSTVLLLTHGVNYLLKYKIMLKEAGLPPHKNPRKVVLQ